MKKEWQPIETVPLNVKVRLGRWCINDHQISFKEIEAVAWEVAVFDNLFHFIKLYGEATHWAPLPEPPEGGTCEK